MSPKIAGASNGRLTGCVIDPWPDAPSRCASVSRVASDTPAYTVAVFSPEATKPPHPALLEGKDGLSEEHGPAGE